MRLALIGGFIFLVYSFLGDFQVRASFRYEIPHPLENAERLELEYVGGDGELFARAVFYGEGSEAEGGGIGRIEHEVRLPKGHHRVEIQLHQRGEVLRKTHPFKMPFEGIEVVRLGRR